MSRRRWRASCPSVKEPARALRAELLLGGAPLGGEGVERQAGVDALAEGGPAGEKIDGRLVRDELVLARAPAELVGEQGPEGAEHRDAGQVRFEGAARRHVELDAAASAAAVL